MTREEAIKVLNTYDVNFDGYRAEEIAKAIDMAIEALQADAVSLTGTMKYLTKPHNYCEVVRCKDCRHRDLFSCPLADNDFQKDEDFCSWGERREPSAEQTEHKLPGHDEVMEALDKMTLRGDDND